MRKIQFRGCGLPAYTEISGALLRDTLHRFVAVRSFGQLERTRVFFVVNKEAVERQHITGLSTSTEFLPNLNLRVRGGPEDAKRQKCCAERVGTKVAALYRD